MVDEGWVLIEKLSKSVDVSYLEKPVCDKCVIFFEEEPHWYRRRKIVTNPGCDFVFLRFKNSVGAHVQDAIAALSFVAKRNYSHLSYLSYGSSAFAMLSVASIIEPDTMALIAPTAHVNAQSILNGIDMSYLPELEKGDLRTYPIWNDDLCVDVLLEIIGEGGGSSCEISCDQAELMRSQMKMHHFLSDCKSDELRAIDLCFERVGPEV